MSTQPITKLTAEEYLELERRSEFRSEYLDGQVFAMAGGTIDHARILTNTLSALTSELGDRDCEAASSDVRVHIAAYRVFTYPDIVVWCGTPQLYGDRRDVISDATFIVEILSPSNKNYDRAEKFEYYRSLPSFSEYLLLAQDRVLAELHTRLEDGSWLFRDFTSLEDAVELKSIACRLPLQALYRHVEFA
ncbi:MAG TPA: Uma2 family endonuclease [Bryobacteraceae bacterium]|nr:Uma2 family endonuclease [Bryobacteraceae bacterium]